MMPSGCLSPRMSHRIIVMCEGRLTGELSGATATEAIMTFATQRAPVTASVSA
jgi:ribose transport system ATP-binding protein